MMRMSKTDRVVDQILSGINCLFCKAFHRIGAHEGF